MIEIGKYAFNGVNKIRTFTIPSQVTTIGENIIKSNSLKYIFYLGETQITSTNEDIANEVTIRTKSTIRELFGKATTNDIEEYGKGG